MASRDLMLIHEGYWFRGGCTNCTWWTRQVLIIDPGMEGQSND